MRCFNLPLTARSFRRSVRMGAFEGAGIDRGRLATNRMAWLYKRLHPSLSFYKLWATWSMLLGGAVALVFAFGLVRL